MKQLTRNLLAVAALALLFLSSVGSAQAEEWQRRLFDEPTVRNLVGIGFVQHCRKECSVHDIRAQVITTRLLRGVEDGSSFVAVYETSYYCDPPRHGKWSRQGDYDWVQWAARNQVVHKAVYAVNFNKHAQATAVKFMRDTLDRGSRCGSKMLAYIEEKVAEEARRLGYTGRYQGWGDRPGYWHDDDEHWGGAWEDDRRPGKPGHMDGDRIRIRLRSEPTVLEQRSIGVELSRHGEIFNPNRRLEEKGDVIIDYSTGLMWMEDTSSKAYVADGYARNREFSRSESVSEYLTRLNRSRYAGYSNWRLPTTAELASIAVCFDDDNWRKRQDKCASSRFRGNDSVWTADRYSHRGGYWLGYGARRFNFQGNMHRNNLEDLFYGADRGEAAHVRAVRSIR